MDYSPCVSLGQKWILVANDFFANADAEHLSLGLPEENKPNQVPGDKLGS